MKKCCTFFLVFSLAALIVSGNATGLFAQKLIIMDRGNNDKIVNDSTITLSSSDPSINQLTAIFTIKNNTDVPLSVFLRKKINQVGDSTSDYFCFYIKCWSDTDTTDIADTIPAGAEDYNFASHVTHIRRFDYPQPALPPGLTSVTYTIFDNTTLAEPVEASVTVIYHLSPLGTDEPNAMKAEVYPNPATDFIRIETDRQMTGKLKAVIYNVQGAVVRSEDIISNGSTLTIKTSDLSPGFYTGILTSELNAHSCFRFVVQAR
ncbi:MAG: T9SS type A sorting domain-containing protein [Bacteroidota bacterium]